jgi:hypothetical protein
MNPEAIAGQDPALSTAGGCGLTRLAELADSFGAEHAAHDARSLAERVAEGRFFVVCVGQFKRGKSTLLNALAGEAILPAGVVPVTTVPTVLRYGAQRGARLQMGSRAWKAIALEEVEQYVSEEHNPGNAKGVGGIELFVPAPLLASGMCLVDTPGLGSVFSENTAATRDMIPHIDAALVVIGADPPISGEELAMVETVARHVRHLLFVLNKADRVTAAERQAATSFARKLLESRLNRPAGMIYEISAREVLESGRPARDWNRLAGDLNRLAEESGGSLTAAAHERGLQRIAALLLNVVGEERRALLRPLEESERRMEALRAMITDAERSLGDLAHLFIAEQHRLSRKFAERRKAFLEAATPRAGQELAQALPGLRTRNGVRWRRQAMRAAQETARRHLLPWLAGEQMYAEQAFQAIAIRFVEMGNDFLRRLAAAGLHELAEMPRPLEPESGFRTRSRFHFHEFMELAEPASPLRFIADVGLGLAGARRSFERGAHDLLAHLLATNASRVQSDVDRRVTDAKARLETDLRILLREIAAVARRALDRARAARMGGAAAVEAALARLELAEQEIVRIQSAEISPQRTQRSAE